jgi:maleylacetoacetate isomerase
MAIIEYLDETHPEPALLPKDPLARARVRALAQSIACEIHPINNLRVLKYLSGTLGLSEDQKNTWYRHWVREGLEAFERQLAQGPESTFLPRQCAKFGRLLLGASNFQRQTLRCELGRAAPNHRCL